MDAICREQSTEQVGWEEFLPDVQPYVFGAPDELVLNAVRSTAIDFCKTTHTLRRLFYADLYKGVENYIVPDPSDGYRANMLLRVLVSGVQYPALSRYPAKPRRYGAFFDRPSRLYLFPAPCKDEEDGLEIELSVFPSQFSCSIDRSFYEDHAQDIAKGAISQILQIPNTSWTDRALAENFFRQYKDAVAREKVRRAKGDHAGPLIARAGRRWY